MVTNLFFFFCLYVKREHNGSLTGDTLDPFLISWSCLSVSDGFYLDAMALEKEICDTFN